MNRLDRLTAAVYRKEYAALDQFLPISDVNERDSDGRTLLMHAVLAEDGEPAMVRYLVEKGIDVNAVDNGQQWTALHFAARDQKTDLVQALLDAGAEVDAKDSFGNTPLWRCVMNKTPNLTIVHDLLARGADARLKNRHGASPADIARSMGNHELLTLLER